MHIVIQAYRVLFVVFLRVDIQACLSICRHRLIPISPRKEPVFFLTVMHTLDDLRTNQRALGHNTLERDHPVQVHRSKGSRVTGELPKSSDIGTVIVLCIIRKART